MDASTFPLAAGIVVPLVFIIPSSILLYALYLQTWVDIKEPETTQQAGNGDLRARNQNAAASKTSLASLDVRPFLKDLHLGRSEPRTVDYSVPLAVEAPKPATPKVVRSALLSYALGITLSLLCGLVYLACVTSGDYSRAIDFPLGISVTIIPFLVLPHSIEGTLKRTAKPLAAEDKRIFRRIVLPLVGSVAVAALGAWISSYIVIAALAIALISISLLALDTSRWPLPLLELRPQPADVLNRNTKSWFSGNGLSEAEAEALARQGNMPRAGETEDAFLGRMQQEGNSWITETGKASASRTHLISSFGYTTGSGRTTPVTPTTPQTAYSRPVSNASARTVDSSLGRKGKDRATNNNSNSWITEPTESGTTLSSFRFDCSDDIPPVPALTASTKARYGVPTAPQAAVPRAIPNGEESTFYGEGPSIIRIGDPANMTFASYDSLPIKYGKRSTNFEILDPSHILPKFRSSKSLSTVSRKHSKRTLSDESFHSAIDDPCQGLGRLGNADQSFPRSISMSSEDQRDVFCDALGSGRDDASFDGDAVETVIDEDEFSYGRGKSFDARRVVSEPVVHNGSSSTGLPPIAGRFMRSDALAKPSTSESEIFLPVASTLPGRYGTQSELPQLPVEERGRYSAYSSVASPMFGAFGPGADKMSTDPLLLRGKASTGMETVDMRPADLQVFQQRSSSAGMAEKGELLGNTAVEANKLKRAFVGNLLVLWISFGLALPVLIEVSRTQRFATALYLVSVILPALALFATCAAVHSPLKMPFSVKGKEASYLRPLKLQPRFSDNAPISEKPRGNKALEVYHRNLQKWRDALNPQLPSTKSGTQGNDQREKRVPTTQEGSTSFEALRFKKKMARRSSEIWLETGQARPSSGRFDRMLSLVAPYPRVSMIQPADQFVMSDIQEVDPDQTPRARPVNTQAAHAIPASPTPLDLDENRFSEYSILNDVVRASFGEYPNSPNRTDFDHSRPDSMISSPGGKSVKLASVQQAVRGRMSLGPTFLIGGSQGDAIITARRSVDLDTALRLELHGSEILDNRRMSTNRAETFIASRASEDQSQFQESNRRSGDILGGTLPDSLKEERRRTFDFGRMWSGWRKASDTPDTNPLRDFVNIDPERLDMIMMADFGEKAGQSYPKGHPGQATHGRTPSGDTFGSTIRESNELSAFRASEDFILPGQRGDQPSFDFGRPSIAPDDRTSFSIDSHADLSSMTTPRYGKQGGSSRGPESALPEMTGVDFLADFKGAIREMGMKAEDTPAREAVRYILAGLATPHGANKKGSSTSIRGILKNRPSKEAKLAVSAAQSMGHSLPPIPIDISRAIASKGSNFSLRSAGRSTPILGIEEEPTSASQPSLLLPAPRLQQWSTGKTSIGPLSSIALHPVVESEEPHAARVLPSAPVAKPVSTASASPPTTNFLAVDNGDAANVHGRSASTNTAIEEIETIMAMDSPTTASYLQTNFLSRPQSVVTSRFDGPVSAPANSPANSFAAAQQSTQRVDVHPLKSSRSTPAFAVAGSWKSSRPTVEGPLDKENVRPGSTYSYLEKELGMPPVPLRDLLSVNKGASLPPTDTTLRAHLGEITRNIGPTVMVEERTSKNAKVPGVVGRKSTGAEQVTAPTVGKRSRSPRKAKSQSKPKARESTRVGDGDASVNVMRF